jgi:hypothetical protein
MKLILRVLLALALVTWVIGICRWTGGRIGDGYRHNYQGESR